jgi:flagellar L-ring protein precursor FlgH
MRLSLAHLFVIAFMLGLLAALAGCSAPMLRTVEVHQPLTVRPQALPAIASANGAIYQVNAQGSAPLALFEDRRARAVGDILTIQINEKINASKTASSAADRKGSLTFNVPDAKIAGKGIRGGSLTAESNNTFEGKGDSAANNLFTGTIAVTVIEVLPNGNLVVSGEKQIGINQGSEFVRLSGVVNPTSIQSNNIVSSTHVADARLEYRGTGYVDETQTMGWLQRVFLTVMPF